PSLFYFFLPSEGLWVLYALYVWSGVLATLVTLRFWTYLSDLFTATDAKRLYGPIGVGSVLGAIVGSFVAVGVASLLDASLLVPTAAGVLAVTALVPLFVMRDAVSSGDPLSTDSQPTLWQDLDLFRSHLHARGIGLFVLISAVTLTLADYIFKSVVPMSWGPSSRSCTRV